MKIVKINYSEQPLTIPQDCYDRVGCDVFFHVPTKEKPMVVNLPSLKTEVRMRLWFKVFILDVEKNAETNNITINAAGEEKVNGVSKLTLKTNGACVMLIPVGASDWICFTPSLPDKKKKKNDKDEDVSTDAGNGVPAPAPAAGAAK